MEGESVEDHVRGVVKDLLRTRGITKKGLVTDINGTKKIPLKGLKYRISVQASAPYDAVEREARNKKMLHRILTSTKDKNYFFAGGRTKLLDKSAKPLSCDDPFMDSWANPMLIKGVPESEKQLLQSSKMSRKALFALGPMFTGAKPFVTRTGGNRSAVLANDVFDVIAEAEETGGAAQRHLGTKTARFGLPASADRMLEREKRVYATITQNKTGDESCSPPKPPVRGSSTITSTKHR